MIRDTARRLFLAHGYEATTLRAVAEEADVGFATVFAYATDKAGLLAMVFVEELKGLPPLFATHEQQQTGDLLATLIDGLVPLYRFWPTIPTLSGQVLQQMEFYGDNPHLDVIVERRAQAKDELGQWLAREQDAGRIDAGLDLGHAADTLFAIHSSAVRDWSATSPEEPEVGLARLKTLMDLTVRAVTPRVSPGRRPGKA